ncbi:hypothetical protein K2637_004681 [Salmonella enterica subsp. enterica serovar Lagos]|nr:hypothetical protein [Salmonella enterica subsp. enterica serovar Lagos]EHW4290254.1 hypothetical protein [Salmonella enterica subsp. enterica serovar Lagos]
MTQFNPNTDVLARIDAGEFDNASPSTVLSLLGEWSKDQFEISDPRFFREAVAQLWIINQCEKNGEPAFAVEGLPCVLPLLPGTVRSFLVTGLESAITERYGSERAETEIRNFYLLMLDAGHGMALTLSPFGVEVLIDICLCILRGAVLDDSTEVFHA